MQAQHILLLITTLSTLLSPPQVNGQTLGMGMSCGNPYCLNDNPLSSSTSCTAKDSPVGLVVACPLSGACTGNEALTCVKNEMTLFRLRLTIEAHADRYDVGVYLARGQDNAYGGSCCRYTLSNLTSVLADESPLSGFGGYANLDSDNCGDIRANVMNYGILEIDAKCASYDGGEYLQIPYCSTWDINDQTYCTGPEVLTPGTGSKCKCGILTVSNVLVRADWYLSALSTNNCYHQDSTVYFDFTFGNSGEVGLTNVVISDQLQGIIECYPASDLTKTYSRILPTSLDVGASFICRSVVTPNPNIALTTTLQNDITVEVKDTRLMETLIKSTGVATVAMSSFTVTETAVLVGNTIEWTVSIYNDGNTPLDTFTVTSDSVAFTCNWSVIEIGQTQICTGTTIIEPVTSVCQIDNPVTVSGCHGGTDCTLVRSTGETVSLQDYICQAAVGDCDLPNKCNNNNECVDVGYDVSLCTATLACTDAVCDPVYHTCSYSLNDSKCQACGSCDKPECVATEDANLWPDHCIHRFKGVGVVIPYDLYKDQCQVILP